MDSLTKARGLAELGLYVFPVRLTSGGGKAPAIPKSGPSVGGHWAATTDREQIDKWFITEYPGAGVGVFTGRSGLVVLDLDRKKGKDGFNEIEQSFLPTPPTFSYPTANGGEHHIYRAPDGVALNGLADYRGMPGVDRRGGSSWAWWHGDSIPASREAFSEAPTWLVDPVTQRTGDSYEGGMDGWLDDLTEGEPNELVSRALGRIQDDFSHSDMVAAQYNLIEYGSNGMPGVGPALDKLLDAWMNRPAENHGTPFNEWQWKFDDALKSGIEKFGATSSLIEDLPKYDLNVLPSGFSVGMLVGDSGTSSDIRVIISELVRLGVEPERIATTLWSAGTTKVLARKWGLEFIYGLITKAQNSPMQVSENPAIEEVSGPGIDEEAKPVITSTKFSILTPEELEYSRKRDSFVDVYVQAGKKGGFANEKFFRANAWTVASLAFAFRGFIPVSGSDKMGLNLFHQVMGYSGTGKSRSLKFRDIALSRLFGGDTTSETSYNLGGDSSPQGLHIGLLQRDNKPSLLSSDESSRFFKQILKSDGYSSSLDDNISHWYEGRVDPSNKVSLKELRGKSALTSFHVSFMGTPDKLLELLTRDLFGTGFLARFSWVLGDPPVETDDRFNMSQQDDIVEFDEAPPEIDDLVIDLMSAARLVGRKNTPILADDESLERMKKAYKDMHSNARSSANWDIIEPSLTRLSETMRKCAAICAMYRGSKYINIDDVLKSLESVQEWYDNIFIVADGISAGEFQRDCDKILSWVISRGGNVTRTALMHAHRNMIVRNSRELDDRLTFLIESGRLVFKEGAGSTTHRYMTNGE